ncbi:MAG: VWA domain-containing protein [Cytophagales bacterium]|nr:VWA domain-containing protein [Cytophagales bacterium]
MTERLWYSWEWFSREVLWGFEWGAPQYLRFLCWILPLLWIGKFILGFWKSRDRQWETASFLSFTRGWGGIFRFLVPLFMNLSIICFFLALSRPQRSEVHVEEWSEGIDILLAIDISESMKIEDFRPNRLEAAKRVCSNFISKRTQDRIGLVVFSGDAFSKAPLTTDYDLLAHYIEEIDFDMIESRGTAIGSALAVSVNRMRESKADSKVVILLSDGDNTAGNIDPRTAAQLAHAYGIRVYTIGVGKEGRVPMGTNYFGQPQYVENTLDESTLRDIARIGKAKFYRASNTKALAEIFSEIDELEKTKIRETRFKDTTDYYPIYLRWGLVFFLLFIGSRASYLHNILSD